jgi:phosphonate transport system permease protein
MTTATLAATYDRVLRARRWSRFAKLAVALALIAFGVWSVYRLNIPTDRLAGMFGRLANMISERLMPPDIKYALQPKLLGSILETLQMSLLGAFIGVLIAMPLSWFAAWNVTPSRVFLYPVARGIIAMTRSVPTLMWAMILVTIFGFGPFAGVLALINGTIGFAGKLMSEQVETIDMKRVEAIRATGANEVAVFFYAVLPQVKPGWIGTIIYNWDAQFRSSTILGFMGAGGMGLYLRQQISVLEYQSAMGIVAVIVVLVMISEAVSDQLRKRLY